ncbi:MAG: N-acetyltransferase [Clostridia bacterium]|nr:N-acetyltransferase [Clostridia bacterium]MBO7319891.1 N-acetyltransferase [Clostridia bacterium]
MTIRKAERKDIEALLEIYNHEVVHGVSTLDINPRTFEQWTDWYENHNIKNHPLIVAVDNGTVTGYATLSSYRQKEAYASTVELSIYVHPEHRGKGIGSVLMSEIISIAKADDTVHTVVSVITSGNAASEHLHEKFGFTFSGTIKEVGMKFGEYLDISNYYLIV